MNVVNDQEIKSWLVSIKLRHRRKKLERNLRHRRTRKKLNDKGVMMSQNVPAEKRAEVAKQYTQLNQETETFRQQLLQLERDHEEHAYDKLETEKVNSMTES